MVQLKNGECYYTKLQPELDDVRWRNKANYVVDFDLTEKQFSITKLSEIVSADKESTSRLGGRVHGSCFGFA